MTTIKAIAAVAYLVAMFALISQGQAYAMAGLAMLFTLLGAGAIYYDNKVKQDMRIQETHDYMSKVCRTTGMHRINH